MNLFTVIIAIALILIVILQIGKISELAKSIRGEEEVNVRDYKRQGLWLFIFGILFCVGTIVSAYAYKNYMLGYGPHAAASAHGGDLDWLFNITLFFTGIVFLITQVVLFYFAYRYRYRPDRKAAFYAHNNTLEYIWTGVPAVVMTFLVVSGLIVWNKVMADIDPGQDYMEIEATGYQFAWAIRYPGADGELGAKDYRLINGANILGQDWTDLKNLDDIHVTDKIVLPVNQPVRVRITSRDVLHNFYLPHFRVKMDAVPGMPTYFVFTPTTTTEEYRNRLSQYKEYQVPADPEDPTGPQKWEAFNYELACAELCGNGHYSMRRIVEIVDQDTYNQWLRTQNSFYMSTIRNTDADPYTDRLFDSEILERKQVFNEKFETALGGTSRIEKTIKLEYVYFETGSSQLTPLSEYELNNLVEKMNQQTNIRIELAGHTDNSGNPEDNINLSQSRAEVVKQFLVDQGVDENRITAKGYGQNQPVDTNDTDEGRANNRRTEVIITNQ